jgi:hypothetical protein
MAAKEELIAVVRGDIKDFQAKMKQVSGTLQNTSGLVDRYGNKIETTNKQAISSTTKATKSFAGMGVSLSKLGGYALAAYGVIRSGKVIIDQSSAATDKLNKALAGLKFGFQSFSSQLVSLDFTNFFTNIDKAIEKGKEIEQRRDKLQDVTRALTIEESKYRDEISALRLSATEETDENGRVKSKEERANDIRKAIELQKELNRIREAAALEAKNIALDVLSAQTQLFDPAAIEQFWNTYNKETVSSLRLQAEEYNKLKKSF